jgi:Phage Terminase
MTSPLDIVHSLVLDDEAGHRWGEVATPEQSEDMEALLAGDGPRRHFWLRARGRSKSTDVAAASIAMLLAGGYGAGDELIAAAAGRDQAALIVRKSRGLIERTPEIAGLQVNVERYRVVSGRTGAALEVISSDLASSWGRTPVWAAIDEIGNWGSGESDRLFAESLLTSLVKRTGSRGVLVTTPSSPSHWSYGLWQAAVDDPLWRTSIVSGPAPWQSPAELESERRRLPDSLWRRLFQCEWCAADDALADASAISGCIRHDGPLPPVPGTGYVIAFDLSVSHDHTAVVIAHAAEEDSRRIVVIDRLEAWTPRGGQVDLADVEAWIKQASGDYGGASIIGDPYQAASMIQRLRDAGLRVKPVTFSAGSNSRRAQMLLRLLRDRDLDLPADDRLRAELLSLRLTEGSTPGTVRLSSDGSSAGHFDRATAVMLAAEELLSRPQGSYLTAMGIILCPSETCGRGFHATWPDGRPRTACIHCGSKLGSDAVSGTDSAVASPAQVGESPDAPYQQVGSVRIWK